MTPLGNLAAWRDAMGLNTYEAAEALGISRTTLWQLEREGAAPSRTVQLAMAALALGCPVSGPLTLPPGPYLALAQNLLREISRASRELAALVDQVGILGLADTDSRDSPGTASDAPA